MSLPLPQRSRSANSLRYEGRWRWWYSAIADLMIAHPDWTQQDIAKALDKTPNTINSIAGTDLFKSYLNARKQEWRERHDHALINKMTAVAEATLDVLLEKLEKKRDQVPISTLTDLSGSMLDRLGYSPAKSPAVQINTSVHDNRDQRTIIAPISPGALEEARAALRLAEQRRGETPMVIEHFQSSPPGDGLVEGEAGLNMDPDDVLETSP